MSFSCNTDKWSNAALQPQAAEVCRKNPYRIYELENILKGMRESLDPMQQAQMGICGTNANIEVATAKTAVGFKYFCLVGLVAWTFDTTLTKDKGALLNAEAGDPLAGILIPAGIPIYGEFSEIKLLAGLVRAYEHPFN